MASTKHVYLTDAAEIDLRTLALRWELSDSGTIARALKEADTKGD